MPSTADDIAVGPADELEREKGARGVMDQGEAIDDAKGTRADEAGGRGDVATAAATGPQASAAVAGSAEGVTCPLCGYDLRGLVEPRCPECGHRFEWAELTDASRRPVPWLFEHRRWLGGLWATQARALWPWRFWRTVRPAHRLRPGRLVLFWMVGFLLLAGMSVSSVVVQGSMGVYATHWRDYVWVNAPMRPEEAASEGLWQGATYADLEARRMGISKERYLAQVFPNPGTLKFWTELEEELQARRSSSYNLQMHVALALPVFSVLPLLAGVMLLAVMRQSRAKAKVLPGHLLRVSTYSCSQLPAGVLLLAANAFLLVVMATSNSTLYNGVQSNLEVVPVVTGVIAILMLTLWGVLQFEAGVRHYLGIPRSWSVALAYAVIYSLMLLLVYSVVIELTYSR